MAFTDAQYQYALYAIGWVESRRDYSAVNTGDPITLGIVQWYAYNARTLVGRYKDLVPSAYAKLSQRIRDAYEQHADDDSWWERFWLTDDDALSFKDATQDTATHTVQDTYFKDYASAALATLEYWTVDLSNAPSAVYYLAMYWQSPAACLYVIRTVGGNRDLATLRQAALANATLGGYVNRYNDLYDILSQWDGTSAPPDFGWSSDTVTQEAENPSGTSSTLSSQVGYIEQVGNDLIVHGEMSSTHTLLCRYTGNGVWVPVQGTNAVSPAKGTASGAITGTGGSETVTDEFAAMKRLWEDNAERWYYSNAAGRLDPPSSGYGDCSSTIYWAANAATNNKYDWIGTRSYYMVDNMTTVWSSTSDLTLPIEQMRPGDVIHFWYHDGTGHVDWYWGGNVSWGAGTGPLPYHVTDDARNFYEQSSWYKGRTSRITVLRFLEG